MRSRASLLAALLPLTAILAGCGGGEVVVQVTSEGPEGTAQPVEDKVVTFLPYDRDSIFVALTRRAEEPEPRVPEDLQEQYEQVQQVQETWRQAERRWSEQRDSLKRLRSRMDTLDRRSRAYLELFDRFNSLEERVNQLRSQKNRLFERFDSLQKTTVQRADSMEAVIRAWENDAFAGYVAITDSLVEERGHEVRRDTTNAEGYARAALPSGDWWVYARHQPGPFEELYWNVHVVPGQPDTLRLSRENAEVRTSF